MRSRTPFQFLAQLAYDVGIGEIVYLGSVSDALARLDDESEFAKALFRASGLGRL